MLELSKTSASSVQNELGKKFYEKTYVADQLLFYDPF